MDAPRFDALARLLAARAPRRAALAAFPALAAGAAGAGRRKKRCRPACAACSRCAKGRCVADPAREGALCAAQRWCREGRCACPGGTTDCPGGRCCDVGLVCDGAGCGACPAGYGICDFFGDAPPVCGAADVAGSPTPIDCSCVTSVQGRTVCATTAAFSCADCNTDAECAARRGRDAVCLSFADCRDRVEQCRPEEGFHLSRGCVDVDCAP